ncbi:MAG: cell surface protein SprA [Gemmatimonadaceae bacterium]|nr:cell surface protein SprA [Chitinophagaceae bacterium]
MLAAFVLTGTLSAYAQTPAGDTSKNPTADTLKYPITDRRADKFSTPGRTSLDLKDPANINQSIEYDPKTKQYYIVEKIGSMYYRKPTYLTYDEFIRLRGKQLENDYFKKRSSILSGLNKKLLKPKLSVTDNLFNRIFGNGKIEIKPQGNVEILAGYQGQKINNPTLPERARKNGGFDFDMNANLNVIANIGDKLKLPINYNTLATFDFDNQLKLDYTGTDDEIIKRIEAGNVSFSTKGSLIQGAQQLFGIKTQLQFGKLYVTSVLANQRSQRQSLGLQGGSASTLFEFKADDYEENRHFLLSQYFRRNYNKAMGNLPAVNSLVQILQLEVWVTNRNGSTTDTRDIVSLMDLGELNPYNTNIGPQRPLPDGLPDNDVNNVYRNIINDPNSRNSSFVTSRLNALGLTPVQDFEKTFARKLSSSDYYFDPQIGFLSLNSPLQPDEILGVAYRYSYNGKIYQVGEFSQDIPPDTTAAKAGTQKVLFLKLLKATSQRPNLPIWDLMMKNVYALKTRDGSYLSSVQPTDFQLNILYEQPSLGTKRYLPEGPRALTPLLSVLRLDTLNNRLDPQPDGIFDYIEGKTILSQQARIIFPLIEPFGEDLAQRAFPGSPQELLDKYVYYPLYDTIKEIAKTYANLDRYIISGRAKGQSTSEISLGAFNVPPGSVTVSSGGQTLMEGIDYSVDYSNGTVKILNQAIINSGIPVNVQFENNGGFGLQQRNYLGLRFDYLAKNTAKESLTIGGQMVRMGERPFFTKVSTQDGDPIRNTMYGVDFSYRSEFPKLTRWLDKLPGYHSTEMSNIQAYGEAAAIKPGHPPQIGKGASGAIYVDDFEGARSNIDLRFPLISWVLASTPQNNGLFPEGSFRDSLPYGFNRAKIAWYNIEPNLQDAKGTNNPVRGYQDFSDPRIRGINQQEIYPTRTPEYGQAQLVTFDLAYYPEDRGPYNYDARPGSVTPSGKLANPKTRWGGIMRAIDQTDFESGNVEYLEVWMQDPFLKKPNSTGGQFYIHLGNISEDILRDGRRQFENGLPGADGQATVDPTSAWGNVPANPIQVTNAFSNDPGDRPFQDVGLDGLTNDSEKNKFGSFLNQIATIFGTGSPVYQTALGDPSSDDFKNYRDANYDAQNADILSRYKQINNPHGNSPIADANSTVTTAFTLYPDQEDLNRDNTLNELEEYFQYKLDLQPGLLQVGQNYITDVRSFTPTIPNGKPEKWYLFRIPIREYESKVGNIPDFKSIRFIRMFLHGFEDSVVARFAKFELVRNQWRSFAFQVDTTGNYTPLPPNTGTEFNVLAVNVEENSQRSPVPGIPYVTPPNIERQQLLSNNNVNILQNEQSMSLQICGLQRNDTRGVFKTFNLDLRQYGNLSMFIHAEGRGTFDGLGPNALAAVIRLGNDFVSNYYEIRIPLTKTNWNTSDPARIWPESNELMLEMQRLIRLKVKRNSTAQPSIYYSETDPDGKTYAVIGNPNLGEVRGIFLGVQNVGQEDACTEVWFNELRLSNLNEKGGWAALGRVDFKLADLGTMTLSGSYKTIGFGNLDQRVNERSRENLSQFDAAANLELGKFFPQKTGISIPTYASYSQTVSTPQYDPYDLDITLKDKLKAAGAKKDSIRDEAVDVQTIKTVNFTNVKKNNTTGKKQKPWSIENIDVSYSYTKLEHHSPLIESDELTTHRGGLGYNYTSTPVYWRPLQRIIKSSSPWVKLIKDFNVNPVPSLLSFRADAKRQFGAFRPRNVGGPKGILPETYNKYFTFDRYYTLRWDLTERLNIDFNAINNARVDEGPGRLNSFEKRKMWNNFWDGGRNTYYQQQAVVTYTLPTSKIPFLDWTTMRVGYTAKYNWIAASLDTVAKKLGNFLSNTQEKNASAEFDLTLLYNKSRWLRALDWDAPAATPAPPAPPVKNPADTTKSGKKKRVKKIRNPNELPELHIAVKVIGRLLTSVKRVSVTYASTGNTSLAGYTDSTKILGMNWRNHAPGFDFVMGRQPDTNYINRFAQKGFIVNNPLLNQLNRQDYNERLTITAQLVPVRDLSIDLNLEKSFGKTYSELFKDTTGSAGFARLSPYTSGSFNVSYIAFNTLFDKVKPNEISGTFQKFQDYRIVLSERLAKMNPYSKDVNGNPIQNSDGYYKGYTRYAQDVLIPAFVAAYTGKDPNTVALVKQENPKITSNPFRGIKAKPNWRVTYNGLTRIKGFEKIFSSFTVTHAYNGSLGMNSFNSALLFEDPLRQNFPGFIDTLTGNFIPYFLVPNISISEAFAPFIDLDMQFTNQLGARFEYKKSRQLSLSLVDFQLSEARATEFTIGARWRKRGFALPFKVPFTKKDTKKLENDITFTFDFGLRDEVTSNSRLDQTTALPTAGQKVITIQPSIDYVLNNRVKVILYFDQRRTIPKISTSAPITNTRGGVKVNISLAQ